VLEDERFRDVPFDENRHGVTMPVPLLRVSVSCGGHNPSRDWVGLYCCRECGGLYPDDAPARYEDPNRPRRCSG
jgi:hypothetical protein